MINPTKAEPVPVCICPLAKPVPMCIYRDPNAKGKLSSKYQFCAIHTADNILQTVKSGWSALLSANCSPFRPSVRTALRHAPIRQQSAPPSAELPVADNNIV